MGVQIVLLVLLPLAIVGVALAPEVLNLWLSIGMAPAAAASFATISSPVLQLVIIAVLINGFALVPTSLVQASGRPSCVAIAYCLQLPLWYFSMVWLTQESGVLGTAMARTARQVIDLIMMLILCTILLGRGELKLGRALMLLLVVTVSVLGMMGLELLAGRIVAAICLLLISGSVGWWYMLEHGQRAQARGYVR